MRTVVLLLVGLASTGCIAREAHVLDLQSIARWNYCTAIILALVDRNHAQLAGRVKTVCELDRTSCETLKVLIASEGAQHLSLLAADRRLLPYECGEVTVQLLLDDLSRSASKPEDEVPNLD